MWHFLIFFIFIKNTLMNTLSVIYCPWQPVVVVAPFQQCRCDTILFNLKTVFYWVGQKKHCVFVNYLLILYRHKWMLNLREHPFNLKGGGGLCFFGVFCFSRQVVAKTNFYETSFFSAFRIPIFFLPMWETDIFSIKFSTTNPPPTNTPPPSSSEMEGP